MLAYVNGRCVPLNQAVVSVLDRGFLYGDGLFETLRFYGGRPFRWSQHLERLARGAAFLGVRLPIGTDELRAQAIALVERNGNEHGLVRITLTRGVGLRGYSPKGADSPTLTMTTHPAGEARPEEPLEWDLVTARFRLPVSDPIAFYKTCNKLPQILARAEADTAGAHEALLLNTEDFIVEASSSNLFWIRGGRVETPPLMSGVLPGITRAVVIELTTQAGMQLRETNIRPSELVAAEGVFLTSSAVGLVMGGSLDGVQLKRNSAVIELNRRYAALVRAEIEGRMEAI